jgi:hypothetical protein
MKLTKRLSVLFAVAFVATVAAQTQVETINVTLTAGQSATFGTAYPFAGMVPGVFSSPAKAKGTYTQESAQKMTPYGPITGAIGIVSIPKVSTADQGEWAIMFVSSDVMISEEIIYNVTVVAPPTPTPTKKPTPTPTPTKKPTAIPKPTPTSTPKKK